MTYAKKFMLILCNSSSCLSRFVALPKDIFRGLWPLVPVLLSQFLILINVLSVSPILRLDRECLYDQFLGDAGGLGSVGISPKLGVVVSLLSKTILQLVTSLTRSIRLGAN